MLAEWRHAYANVALTFGNLGFLLIALKSPTPAGIGIAAGLIGSTSLYAWYVNLRRFRSVADTPTSRVSSAPQGYVEVQRSRDETRKKNPNLSEEQLDSVAEAVGIGALKYPLLARENAKVVTFDWQSALDFNGQAAPYIQYAHVRCNSILRKANVQTWDESIAGYSYDLDPAEIELIELISRFPSEVQRAAEEYKPLVIASIAYDIAKAFASFYDKCPVIQAEEEIRNARLQLVMAARQTMANALRLLGIQAPDVM